MRSLLGKTVIVCLFLFAVVISAENAAAQSMRQYGAGFDVPPQAILNPYTGRVEAILPGYPVYTGGFGGFNRNQYGYLSGHSHNNRRHHRHYRHR